MSAVVQELQREALDRSVRVSDLLRKALVVARKLDLKDFRAWIENELNGYPDGAELPPYRYATGQIKAWNPVRGSWIPVILDDQTTEQLSKRGTSQAISELERLDVERDGEVHMPFPERIRRMFFEGQRIQMEASLVISRASIGRMIDSVRTVVLNWALELEERGVLGEGLSFSREEKTTAATLPQNVNNFYGPVHGGAQIQHGVSHSVQAGRDAELSLGSVQQFVERVRRELPNLNVKPDVAAEAEAEIATIAAQATSPRPKSHVVREALATLQRILEDCGGGVAAQLAIEAAKLLAG